MVTENPTTRLICAEQLTQMIAALCKGQDPLVIGFALSTVLAEVLMGHARQQAAAMHGSAPRAQQTLKRHYMAAVSASLRPLDAAP